MPALLSPPLVSLPLAFMGRSFEWGDMVIVGLLVLLEGRPECLAFWVTMAACFGIGVLPKRQHAGAA